MVRQDLEFIGIKDFYKKSLFIRGIYLTMRREEKIEYKYFVYSRPFLQDCYKDVIWQYLNEELNSPYYISQIDLYSESRKSKI